MLFSVERYKATIALCIDMGMTLPWTFSRQASLPGNRDPSHLEIRIAHPPVI